MDSIIIAYRWKNNFLEINSVDKTQEPSKDFHVTWNLFWLYNLFLALFKMRGNLATRTGMSQIKYKKFKMRCKFFTATITDGELSFVE